MQAVTFLYPNIVLFLLHFLLVISIHHNLSSGLQCAHVVFLFNLKRQKINPITINLRCIHGAKVMKKKLKYINVCWL